MQLHISWLPFWFAMGCVQGKQESLPLPDVPTQQGVVYVSGTPNQLMWYDITGDAPSAAGSLEFNEIIDDLAVDSINHRLAVATDTKVTLMSLDTPADGIEAPSALSEISFPDENPEEVLLDPYHDRLYVQTSGHGIFHGDDHYETFPRIHIVDISGTPTVLATTEPDGWPQMALDPVRQILFVVINGNDLAIYDVGADTLDEMTGSPFNVRRDYPEDGSHIFQIFTPRVDPWSARFFAERQQGGQSELIAYRYDEHVPTDGATYSEGASVGSMRNLSTALDMGTDFRDRQVPLDSGPNPLPDPHTGEVMVVTKVEEEWGVVSLNASLQPGGQCTDEDGPFCTLRNWEEGEPLGALGSNGTACIDAGRRTVSATTSGQFGGGTMQFFHYDAEGDLSAWLGESGSPLPTIETPYNAVCH